MKGLSLLTLCLASCQSPNLPAASIQQEPNRAPVDHGGALASLSHADGQDARANLARPAPPRPSQALDDILVLETPRPLVTRAQLGLELVDVDQLNAWALSGTPAKLEEFIPSRALAGQQASIEYVKTFTNALDVPIGALRKASESTWPTAGQTLFFEAPDPGRTWTLEFYLHPRGRSLFAGCRRVQGENGQERIVPVLIESADGASGAALDPDAWNHVAFAFDLDTTGTARVLVNDQIRPFWFGGGRAAVVDPAQTPAPLASLRGLGFNTETAEPYVTFADVRLGSRFVSSAHLTDVFDPLNGVVPNRMDTPTFDWSASALQHAVVEDGALVWAPGQWRRDEPVVLDANGQPDPTLSPPLPRTCHAVVGLGDGRLLVFGGELRDSHLGGMANGGDTWIYDLRAQTWEQVMGEGPPPRCHIGIATNPDHSMVFLQGGWFNPGPDEDEVVYIDTWLFDPATKRWSEQPRSREDNLNSDVQPVFDEARGLFVYAAATSLWTFDPSVGVLEWQPDLPIYVEGSKEVYRGLPGEAMTWYDTKYKLIARFGGYVDSKQVDKELQDKMFLYFPARNLLVRRQFEGRGPAPRTRGAIAYDTKRQRVMLFGGILGGLDERIDDLWTYDVEANRWTELRAANRPGQRGGYFGMAYDAASDTFVVPFGRQDKETFPDEVWRLEWRPDAIGSARFVFRSTGWPLMEPQATWGQGAGHVEWRVKDADAPWGAWGHQALVGATATEQYVDVRVSLPPDTRLDNLEWVAR